MERLTEKDMNGDYVVLKKCAKTQCISNCDECEVDKEAMKKLKEYEDAEEQGLLIRLPCKPETKLYWLSDEGYGYEPIEEIEVVDFLYNGYSIQMYFADKGEKYFLPLPVEAIGNELFFTKEEAECGADMRKE